jgi:hypothetical protein
VSSGQTEPGKLAQTAANNLSNSVAEKLKSNLMAELDGFVSSENIASDSISLGSDPYRDLQKKRKGSDQN